MKDRRLGPDGVMRALQGLVLICWGSLIALLIIYHYARPQVAYGFLVYGGISVRNYWHPALTPWLIYGLWGSCGLTLAVLLLERTRGRRREDALQLNLTILLLVLIAGLLFYYVG
ncbi:MAG: hypothetical protein ACRCWL_10730 [Aeromonas sp.]